MAVQLGVDWPVTADWPFTGREAELAEIERSLDAGVGVLLVGGAGVGKSALLHAALARAGRDRARVVRLEDLAEPAAAALPGSRAGTRRVGHPPGRCGGGVREQVVLWADDIHLLDGARLELAHRLVNARQAVLLAAVTSQRPVPDLVRRLSLKKLVRRLSVDPLDRSGTARVLAARLGGPVAADTVEELWTLAHGSALVLRELIDHALAEGDLRQVRGSWHWPGLSGVPDGRLVDLAELLLGELDRDERELVGMLALAGHLEAGLPVVAALGEAAEALNRRGVVVTERSGFRLSLRLANPFCAAVAAASLPELTARRLRLRIADALEGTGVRRAGDASRIARLRLATGWIPEPARLRATTLGVLRDQDYPLAERLCRAALAGDAAVADPRWELLLGEALIGQGRHAEAQAHLARTARSGAPAGLLRLRVLDLALGLHRPAEAEALVAEAEALLGGADADAAGPVADAGEVADARSLLRLLAGRPAGIQVAGTPAGRSVLAYARHELGDDEGAFAALRGSRDGGDNDNDDNCDSYGDDNDEARLERWALAGRIALHTGGEAEAVALLNRPDGGDEGPRQRMHTALLAARIHRGAGRTARAVDLLRQAAVHRGPDEWLTTRAGRLAQLAGALAESGEGAEAVAVLDEARAAVGGAVAYPVVADEVALEHALVRAYLGDRTAAAREALRVAERAGEAGRRTQALAALHLAARAGEAGRAVALLPPEPAAGTPGAGGLTAARAAHVRALADHDGDALDAAATRFEDLGLLPLAAEAAALAARAHQAAGGQRKSRASRARSGGLVSRCDLGLPDWAVDEGRREAGAAVELTTREREVVTLAVSQLSNQEIATQLVLSVRTVENHLYRAYAKLGVATRAELAHRMGKRPVRVLRAG
ncbi:LuxR C-terminal-related transcriptional regulator [Kitasatospora sp. NPDC094011]|uniref:helix-turn-helix transcriptional regulator n=1 Tax=Kitasatospora sp. NPDC094011 TaxID=3364090 RepID=UPI0038061117